MAARQVTSLAVRTARSVATGRDPCRFVGLSLEELAQAFQVALFVRCTALSLRLPEEQPEPLDHQVLNGVSVTML